MKMRLFQSGFLFMSSLLFVGLAQAADLVCVSDGGRGIFEKFQVTSTSTGLTLGVSTSFATCKKLVSHQNQGLACVSDGGTGVYQKFIVADFTNGATLGGWTQGITCLQLVKNATAQLTCASDGGAGAYERFQLFSRANRTNLGESISMGACVRTILQ